jgi:apolipoprotein N-acyltransferase
MSFLTMLNWNEILSGLALAVAGFAYALFCFVLLPFRQYDFAAPLWTITMAIAFTAAVNWLLSSSLLTGWIWVAALFGFQVAIILFCGEFVGGGLILSSLLFFGTAIVGIASIYTDFSQQKTLLIVGLCTLLFIGLMYLFLIGNYTIQGKNPFQGSSKQMKPLLNQRVEIRTDNPQQLELNGKTGKLVEINRYEVTVKLDDETLIWPYVDVWWQDIKAVES